MAHREYVGSGITVHWDSIRCIHWQLCVLGAPSVFDFDARPWERADRFEDDRNLEPSLTTDVPQTRHRIVNMSRLPWSQLFDRIFRNEEVAGSSIVNSTSCSRTVSSPLESFELGYV